MAFFKKRHRGLALGAKAIPIGIGVAGAVGGLLAAYLRWFRPGVAAELTGTPVADNPTAPPGAGTGELASHFRGLDGQHAATHYPPSLERDAASIEKSIHEG